MPDTPHDPAELLRTLGQHLSTLRHAAQLSQQQLAHHTGYSRSSVAHAESGSQQLRREFWATADHMTSAHGELLAGWEHLQTATAASARRSQETAVTAAYTALRAQRSHPPLTDGPTTTLWDDLGERVTAVLDDWVDEMNRRRLFRVARNAVGVAVASPFAVQLARLDSEESARVVGAIESPSRVDAAVISHLGEMHRLLQVQDDTLGARSVLGTAVAQRDVVRGLLAGCPSDLRPDLLTVNARMSCSIGHYLIDLDDLPGAARCLDQAHIEARCAGDVDLDAYALCTGGQVAVMNGDISTGVELTDGIRGLSGSKIIALTHDRIAEAHSFRNDHSGCMSALEKARGALSDNSTENTTAYHYDESYRLRHESTYLIRLGKNEDAVNSASDGVTMANPAKPDAAAYTTLALAVAHIAARQIDESAGTLSDAASFAAINRTDGLVKQIRDTRALLKSWNDSRSVKELDITLERLRLSE